MGNGQFNYVGAAVIPVMHVVKQNWTRHMNFIGEAQ
jgi:hypothetical protein